MEIIDFEFVVFGSPAKLNERVGVVVGFTKYGALITWSDMSGEALPYSAHEILDLGIKFFE